MAMCGLDDGGIHPDISNAGKAIVHYDYVSLNVSAGIPEWPPKEIDERALTRCKLPWGMPMECSPASPQATSITWIEKFQHRPNDKTPKEGILNPVYPRWGCIVDMQVCSPACTRKLL